MARWSVRDVAKRVVRAALRPMGLEIVHAIERVEPGRRLRQLRALGWTPDVVIDIGVAEGTPWLYAVFPTAQYILVEPQREAEPHLQRLTRELHAVTHRVALGEAEGSLALLVRPAIGGASMYEEVGDCDVSGRYLVPVQRFDALVPASALDGRRVLCKIDVQGAELAVLRGMGDRLPLIDLVLVETSTIATLHGGAEFRDVHDFLDANGYVLYDVLGLNRRPLDGALAQADLLYVAAGSPLRADRRWG